MVSLPLGIIARGTKNVEPDGVKAIGWQRAAEDASVLWFNERFVAKWRTPTSKSHDIDLDVEDVPNVAHTRIVC